MIVYSKLGIISFISLILSALYLAVIFAVHQSFFVELDGALVVTCLDGMLRHLAANAETKRTNDLIQYIYTVILDNMDTIKDKYTNTNLNLTLQ